ncbi:MAG: hypothetical protein R2822_23760 [Spirosomataceae bacterium]
MHYSKLLLALLFSSTLFAQTKPTTLAQPKLVVGIVVDQMQIIGTLLQQIYRRRV